MEKKHNKNTPSFAGAPSMKNTRTGAAKKPGEKTHIPQKSNANLDKKTHPPAAKTTHKPAVETIKKTTTKTEEPKVEKQPVKTEKKEEKKEKPVAKTEKHTTSNKSNISSTTSSSSSIQNALEKVDVLKKENIELKKKLQDLDKENKDLINEITENQKNTDHFIKERNEMEVISKKSQQELKLITQRNDELTKKVQELQDDVEIYKEESETKDLEIQFNQKQFDEYKVKTEAEIKQLKLQLSNKGNTSTQSETKIEDKKEQDQEQSQEKETGEKTGVSSEEVRQLEDIINDLSKQLDTTIEERDYAISYYKGEIEKQNQKMQELKEKVNLIPGKDELIQQLTEKLKEEDSIIENLENNIAMLSPANEAFDDLVIEKEELEKTVETLRNENIELKDAAKDNEETITELESALQLSEQVMKNSQDEALEMKNQCEEMKVKVKEYEENQTSLLEKIEDLKNKNKMLKEDTNNLRGDSKNMNNLYIEYMTSKNIIQNLKRQKIASEIANIDNERYLLRNKIVKNMIPKKLLETGNMNVFDKFLNINSYREKAFKLIMNQLNNEILTDDLGINPNKVEDDKMGKVEGEEKKKVISFFETTINTLTEFYSYLLKIEIYLGELTSEQFLKINNENSFNDVYHTIIGGSSIFNTILNFVKSNNFSIQNKSNIDGLKNINNQLKTEIAALENIEENNLYIYLMNILTYFINIACGFKKERIDIIVEDLDVDDKLKIVAKYFFDSNKNLNNLIEKMETTFFSELRYPLGNTLLDIENNYFQDLTNKTREIETELNENKKFDEKYTSLMDLFSKVYTATKEAIEKFDPSKIEEETKNYEDDRIILPIKEWNNITDVLYNDLDNITKVTEELDKQRNLVEEEKKKYTELQMNFENLQKTKNENDSKLGELIVQLGKFKQLESLNEENAKIIQKYKIAVEGLQSTVNNFETKEKEYKERIEILEKRDKEKRHMKKAAGVDLDKLKLSNGVGEDGESINGGELIRTVYLLQKERKNYKNKLMKEKLSKLIEDKDSYVNKYIEKDIKISKNETEKEKIMYKNIQDKIISLNKGYDKLRNKLCLPKVYDITNKDYNYEKIKKQQEDEIENTRVQYMNDVDSIFYNMFGENTNSKTMKEMVNSDINKDLEKYADKKFMVGKIMFNDGKKEESKDLGGVLNSKNILGIPIIINEEGFRKINQNFVQ